MVRPHADAIVHQLPADEYPHLVELATQHVLKPGYDYGDAWINGAPGGCLAAARSCEAMRTRSIQPGDIVFCNKGGRLFHAKVIGLGAAGALTVEPIERNISYRQVRASEIADHWTHRAATRREDRPEDAQTALDLGV